MSMTQLSQAVHQIQAQMAVDHQWMTIVKQAITNHANMIDEGRRVHKLEVTRMKAVHQQNDTESETMLEANDAAVKAVIESTSLEAATRIQGLIDTVKVDVARLQSMCESLNSR